MRRIIVMCALVGAVVGCETKGVVVSEYARDDGAHVRLEQFSRDRSFFYSLSATLPGAHGDAHALARPSGTRACKLPELKIVAMGTGGLLSVRVKTQRSGCT